MQEFWPAVVYAPQASAAERAELERLMIRERLFYIDTMQEREHDLKLSVLQRPQLRRYLDWLPVQEDEEVEILGQRVNISFGRAHAFIANDRHDLGLDIVEQLAYIGAILARAETTRLCISGATWNRQRWTREVGQLSDTDRLYDLIDELADKESLDYQSAMHTVAEQWPQPEFQLHRVPTHLAELAAGGRDYADACLRARELALNLSVPKIVNRLNLEGYRNEELRVLWYPDLVRKALNDNEAILGARPGGQFLPIYNPFRTRS